MLSQLLAGIGAARRIDRLASEIAVRSRHAVKDRLGAHADTMGNSELAGYVRARAAAVIHPAVEAMLNREAGLPLWSRDALLAQATEAVVHLVSRDLLHDRWKQSRRAA